MEKYIMFPGNRTDSPVFFTGASICAAGMLSLRCFLRSRLVSGALLLYLAVLLCVVFAGPWLRRNTKTHLRLFGVLISFFTAIVVPAVILAFLGVFHPFWIFASVVILSGGSWRLAQAAHSPSEDQRHILLGIVAECQLVIVPLFLLLYFTNVSASTFFVWLYPVFCLFVPVLLRCLRSVTSSRIIDHVLAAVSTCAVLAGFLSEFIF